jgi:ferritin-like metal-binding protein YciE
MGLQAAVKAMERALKEGKAYDERLTQLAETEVTPALLALESEEEAEDQAESQRGRSRKNGGSERRLAN